MSIFNWGEKYKCISEQYSNRYECVDMTINTKQLPKGTMNVYQEFSFQISYQP